MCGVLCDSEMNLTIKARVYRTVVRPTLTTGQRHEERTGKEIVGR